MRRLLFIAICFCMALSVSAGKKKDFVDYRYELTLAKENVAATSGFKVFKVWSYGKKKDLLTKDICMRNAVHGLLFKGLAANDSGTQGNVRPLCPEGYQAHKEYFDRFFESGEYRQFVQFTSRGAQSAGDVIKGKKEWQVGMLVQVNLNGLRKRLEKDGIIEGARSIFSR